MRSFLLCVCAVVVGCLEVIPDGENYFGDPSLFISAISLVEIDFYEYGDELINHPDSRININQETGDQEIVLDINVQLKGEQVLREVVFEPSMATCYFDVDAPYDWSIGVHFNQVQGPNVCVWDVGRRQSDGSYDYFWQREVLLLQNYSYEIYPMAVFCADAVMTYMKEVHYQNPMIATAEVSVSESSVFNFNEEAYY
jgi:hypothetical protein